MALKQPHLELRPTGFFWRRRVPAHAKMRFIPAFFCFPLKTQVIREAAVVARRLTAISDICFYAEIDMSPDIMTNILTTYASLEIEASDRLRALTGPRSRQAAETALAVEAASRAALHDAIFLCDKSPALDPIRVTAQHLGITLDEKEEDFFVLADKMLRLLIELSDEKDRRARGVFSDTQPYLQMALQVPQPIPAAPSQVPVSASEAPIVNDKQETLPAQTQSATSSNEDSAITAAEAPAEEERQKDEVFFEREGLKVSVQTAKNPPAHVLDGSDGGVLDLWDSWFEYKKNGLRQEGSYIYEDEKLAEKFKKDAGTVQSTRKIISDMIGNKPIHHVTDEEWAAFNNLLFKLPKNHGKSPLDKEQHCFEIIEREQKKKEREQRKAEIKIQKERIGKDEAEALREKANFKTIAPRTVQRHQGNLRSALNHAVDLGVISHNSFKPFVLSEKAIDELRNARPETTRMLWLGEFKDLLGKDKWTAAKTEIDDPLYWLPIIARLHGLRSEEILQLKPENIRSDSDVLFFDIERGTGQSAKSNNARRFVPIHSQLLELGFMKLVEHQKSLGKRRIFDKVNRSKSSKNTFTATFTKKFTYYRKSREIYAERLDFHALRTTFNSKMVGYAIPDTARRYMMGHRNEDVGIINYLPEGFPLKTLKELLELDQIDLSMVTRRFEKAETPRKGPYLAAQDGVKMRALKTA
ncbi:tyrosine-type recombinase/integrase [Halocynthiibacter styelae]|uniref:Tyrosine-type recombinase/integrase n=1 Tax=Halocynthiibacter styelae TaxID=2761955 RepID=A0A8J7IC82_9RHOB|nr:tyrosine-type recombinase/integrase [Paenihalocynthiibacter styelae]MBI1492434.1 tyrosine-type recombinase/integrase [Paenihalocynthiibacter styelae]